MSETPRHSPRHQQDLWDKIWRDKHGEIVIWQTPSIPLIAWVVFTIVSIFTSGAVYDVFWYLGLASLTVWAILEILKGASYFRRFLGVFVALLIIAACFKVGY